MGPCEPFTGHGIVREISTIYVRLIKVVSSFLLMVKTLIFVDLGGLGFLTEGLEFRDLELGETLGS